MENKCEGPERCSVNFDHDENFKRVNCPVSYCIEHHGTECFGIEDCLGWEYLS